MSSQVSVSPRSYRYSGKGPKAFSLIEILVGITILSVLLLLLFFGGRRAINAAHNTRCQANLRMCAGAFMSFAADNNGVVILNVYASGTHPSTRRWADYLVGTMTGSWDGRQFPRIDYTGGNREGARCPAEDIGKNFSTGHSYGAMLVPNEDDPYTIAPGDLFDWDKASGSPRIHAVRLTTMGDAMNYWLIADSWASSYERQIYIIRNQNVGESSKIHLRHNGKANMLFADGSVRSMGPKALLDLRYNALPYGYNENKESISF